MELIVCGLAGVLGKIRLSSKSPYSFNAIGFIQKSCCRSDTLFFSAEQKTGRQPSRRSSTLRTRTSRPPMAAPRSTTAAPPVGDLGTASRCRAAPVRRAVAGALSHANRSPAAGAGFSLELLDVVVHVLVDL